MGLKTTVAGSRLLEHLRAQPFVVGAWWIAADIDAIVLSSTPGIRQLRRAIAGLQLMGGAREVETHEVLRQMGLAASASPITSSEVSA
ncbi:MAG TPA: hypothetical protein VN408_01435 [Actinoplanes sp.]|nr:hypothetical protein [Actinoplanes sp.]